MIETPSRKRQLALIAGILLLAWLWAAFNPLSRGDWLLENLLVFFFAGLLLATYRRFAFSLTAYWLFALFLGMHLYGSHYTYSETPLGYWFQEAFALGRNHYDRLVHFSFGLLLVYPLRELLQRSAGLSGRWLAILSLAVVMAMSALYEQVEMLAAVIVSPELGSAFLGTQGDEWDAQKDSGLAMLGALSMLLLLALGHSQDPASRR
ncbi:Inner membrane protein YjdF [compost metagenome]